MKTCRICKTEKETSEYYTKKSSKDGYTNECKVCVASVCKNKIVKTDDYYIKNAETIATHKKVCTKCNIEKKLIEFPKKKASKDGFRTDCKVCFSSHKRAYNTVNKVAIAEYSKVYRVNNKVAITAKQKVWRDDNKEYIAKKDKIYHANNKEVYRAYNKKYLHTENGRLANRNKNNKRRAIKLATTNGSVPINIRYPLTAELAELMVNQNNKCVYCDTYLTLDKHTHLDHIIPLSKKGEHILTNVQWLCSTCNLQKNNMTEVKFLARRES